MPLFLVCKNHKYVGNLCCFTFSSWIDFLEHISAKKIFRRNLSEKLFRSGSGCFQKPDPVKNRLDLQHCTKMDIINLKREVWVALIPVINNICKFVCFYSDCTIMAHSHFSGPIPFHGGNEVSWNRTWDCCIWSLVHYQRVVLTNWVTASYMSTACKFTDMYKKKHFCARDAF
jgi:hypothetical protein